MATNYGTSETRPRAFAGVAALLRPVLGLLISIGQAQRCAREVERLRLMSDAELARRGLKREDIAGHAFARYMTV